MREVRGSIPRTPTSANPNSENKKPTPQPSCHYPRWKSPLGPGAPPSPWEGHREGAKRFREIVAAVFDLGIPYFTFWGGSEDNFKRDPQEVQKLLAFAGRELEHQLRTGNFARRKVRVRFLGRWKEFLKKEPRLCQLLETLQNQTKKFKDRQLTVLLAYDGRREMLEALKKLRRAKKPVDAKTLKKALWTGNLPDVDLVIRTGGEPHWSAGFMMWLTANSQFYFSKKFWPGFKKPELQQALRDYSRRERRFGR